MSKTLSGHPGRLECVGLLEMRRGLRVKSAVIEHGRQAEVEICACTRTN